LNIARKISFSVPDAISAIIKVDVGVPEHYLERHHAAISCIFERPAEGGLMIEGTVNCAISKDIKGAFGA
jgi:hypothetical protein